MGKLRQNLSALVLVIASTIANAQPRALTAYIPAGSIVSKIDSSLMSAILRPTPLKQEDHFYRSFVAGLDDRIEREYFDRWYFHELQQSYGTHQSQNQKHLNPGTLEFHDNAVSERDYRRGFAQQVLSLRLQRGVEEYLKTWKTMKSMQKTMEVLREASTQSFSLAQNKPGQISRANPFLGDVRFGYDIFRDFTKLEYSCPALDLGLYHTSLLGTAGSVPRSTFSQLVVKTGENAPTPTLRYRFEASAMDIGLSKTITKSLSGSVATTQPIGRGTEKGYGVSLSYSF